MYELTVEGSFAAAHQLRGYGGKCEKLHGHNWKVQAHVTADRLNEIDIAMDFNDLKKMLSECLAPLDHAFLNDVFPFTEKNPSSENVAKWVYDSLKRRLNNGVQLSAVTVWENETSSATYYED
ncbi:MAG: 6-carboxytetrahydropterin synthase QueD [Actinomycetota bacterium]|nr:6-carboxytetrahydropterin synthase QueD [Actinomycetota bacterium]MDA8172972.1 6-carboxytetrahydropterin synthase QueD [Nitrospiraceae bacterium]